MELKTYMWISRAENKKKVFLATSHLRLTKWKSSILLFFKNINVCGGAREKNLMLEVAGLTPAKLAAIYT